MSAVQPKSVDSQIDAIVEFLFGFQSPTDLSMPQIDWDLFALPQGHAWPSFAGIRVGEALSGLHPDKAKFIWTEVAHLDILLGRDTGPVGHAFAGALANQKYGFNNLLGVVNPNVATKPPVLIVTKVETNTRGRANQMFGSVQSAIADAMVDALEHGFFPSDQVNDLMCIAAVFVDPNAGATKGDDGKLVMLTGAEAAASNHRLYCLNYVSMLAALWMAVSGGRSSAHLIETKKKVGGHVLRGFTSPALDVAS